jgi:type IV pilus assembly protein PilC
MNISLPIFTVVLISLGSFLGAYGAIVVPLFILLCIGAGVLFTVAAPFKQLGQSLLFLFPGIHTIVQEVELARFGYITGSLLSAGLPFPQTLDLLASSTGFYAYKKFYTFLHARIEEGNTLTHSIASYPSSGRYIPIPYQELISASERSGHLAETLMKIGERAEAKTDVDAKNLTVLMEPILLVIVWLGVLWVAISVIVPIYSLIGGLNNATQ